MSTTSSSQQLRSISRRHHSLAHWVSQAQELLITTEQPQQPQPPAPILRSFPNSVPSCAIHEDGTVTVNSNNEHDPHHATNPSVRHIPGILHALLVDGISISFADRDLCHSFLYLCKTRHPSHMLRLPANVVSQIASHLTRNTDWAAFSRCCRFVRDAVAPQESTRRPDVVVCARFDRDTLDLHLSMQVRAGVALALPQFASFGVANVGGSSASSSLTRWWCHGYGHGSALPTLTVSPQQYAVLDPAAEYCVQALAASGIASHNVSRPDTLRFPDLFPLTDHIGVEVPERVDFRPGINIPITFVRNDERRPWPTVLHLMVGAKHESVVAVPKGLQQRHFVYNLVFVAKQPLGRAEVRIAPCGAYAQRARDTRPPLATLEVCDDLNFSQSWFRFSEERLVCGKPAHLEYRLPSAYDSSTDKVQLVVGTVSLFEVYVGKRAAGKLSEDGKWVEGSLTVAMPTQGECDRLTVRWVNGFCKNETLVPPHPDHQTYQLVDEWVPPEQQTTTKSWWQFWRRNE